MAQVQDRLESSHRFSRESRRFFARASSRYDDCSPDQSGQSATTDGHPISKFVAAVAAGETARCRLRMEREPGLPHIAPSTHRLPLPRPPLATPSSHSPSPSGSTLPLCPLSHCVTLHSPRAPPRPPSSPPPVAPAHRTDTVAEIRLRWCAIDPRPPLLGPTAVPLRSSREGSTSYADWLVSPAGTGVYHRYPGNASLICAVCSKFASTSWC